MQAIAEQLRSVAVAVVVVVGVVVAVVVVVVVAVAVVVDGTKTRHCAWATCFDRLFSKSISHSESL